MKRIRCVLLKMLLVFTGCSSPKKETTFTIYSNDEWIPRRDMEIAVQDERIDAVNNILKEKGKDYQMNFIISCLVFGWTKRRTCSIHDVSVGINGYPGYHHTPEEYMEHMQASLAKMKEAGVDEVIAELQREMISSGEHGIRSEGSGEIL